MPEKIKLMENKDKEPDQQNSPIQANTIRTKLASLKHLSKFVAQRKIFIGLNSDELKDLKFKCKELMTNLKNLCKERRQDMHEFKSSVLISPKDFKEYGGSEHVKELNKLLLSVEKDSEPSQKLTV